MATIDEKSDNIKLGASVVKIVTDYETKRATLIHQDGGHIYTDMRENEKRQLQTLNDLLAAYLERLSHLQLQSKDKTNLKDHWQRDLVLIREKYQRDVDDTRTFLQKSTDVKTILETEFTRLRKDMEECRRKVQKTIENREANQQRIDELLIKLGKIEIELSRITQHIRSLEEEAARLRRENSTLEDQIRQANIELTEERRKIETYPERVEKLEQKNELKRQELEAKYRLYVRRNVPISETDVVDCREISSAIFEIRGKFEEWALQNKVDVEELLRTIKIDDGYVKEIAHYREESNLLRVQLKKLEEELFEFENNNSMLNKDLLTLHFELKKERRQYEENLSKLKPRIQFYVTENSSFLQKISDLLKINQSLQAELDHYKSLIKSGNGHLDGLKVRMVGRGTRIESRNQGRDATFTATRAVSVDQENRIGTQSEVRSNFEETISRVLTRQSAKGDIKFVENIVDDKFITLENSGQTENLGGWYITRMVNNGREVVYHFPENFVFKSGKRVQIWVNGQDVKENFNDVLVFHEVNSWGNGVNVTTILYNREEQERSRYTRTTASS